MNEGWFSETLYPDFRQLLQVDKIIYQGRTGFQDICIFETPRFGRVLTLDGVIQTTERDEFCYHEMLVHVPLIAHGAAKRMAIIGGGDGGALEEALKHKLEKVTMVALATGCFSASSSAPPSPPPMIATFFAAPCATMGTWTIIS